MKEILLLAISLAVLTLAACGGDSSSAPAAPNGVTASPGDSLVTLSWNLVEGATGYHIYSATTPGVTILSGTRIDDVSTPYIHSGLTNFSTYNYVVTAFNGSGESAESDEVSTMVFATSGSSSNARSDALLREFANDAAVDSGIASFALLTITTADETSEVSSDATTSALLASNAGFLSIDANATPATIAATALGNAMSSIGNAGAVLRRFGVGPNAATESQNVSGTFACVSGGTVTLSGTITEATPDDPDATSGTITDRIENLDISFSACDDGSYTLWGQIRQNTDDTVAFNISADGSSGSFNISFDEYLDGGMVVRRNSDLMAWNFTLREIVLGIIVLSISDAGSTVDSVNVTVTSTQVNNETGAIFSCNSIVTSEAELNNPTVTCTAN